MIKISFRKLLGSAVVFIASLSVVMLIGIKADAASNVSISKENFPDKTIRKIATSHDKNKDGYLSTAEIKKIKKVKIGQKAITSFKGIEKFSCLKTFIYKGNSTTKESVDLDLSKNKKLKSVEIAYTASGSDQSIRKINLQGCKKLEILRVVGQTKQINLTGCINLREIYLYSEGGLQTLDVSNCKRLEKLNVANGPKLKKIKFGKIKSLKDLEIRNCKKLNTLNIKKQIKLESLTMFNLPKLQSLNVSKNAKLQAISLVQVPISEIDLSAHKKLSHFHCVGTNLKKLDLSTTKITETMKDNDEYFRCYDEAVEVIFAKVGSVPNTARATKQNKPKQRVSISGVTYVFEPEDTNSEYAEGGNVYIAEKFTQEYEEGQPVYTEIILQDEIDGYRVDRVGAKAFANHPEIKKVVLSEWINVVGPESFRGCTGLEEIVLPPYLKYIGKRGFANCSELKMIELPKAVSSIGEYAFENCMALTSVAFPDDMWTIGKNAFVNCISLGSITFGKKAYQIDVGENAFANTLLVNESRSKGEPTIVNRGILLEAQGVEGDIKLTGEQVRIVLSSAFTGNKKIEKLTLDGVKRIGSYAFSNSSVTKVNIKNAKTIGRCAFEKCKKLKKCNISGVRMISYGMFSECKNLNKVTFNDAKTIQHAFGGCKKLKLISVLSDEEVKWWKCGTNGVRIFDDCKNLKTINLKSRKVSKTIQYAGVPTKAKLNVRNKQRKIYGKYVNCKVI